MPLNLNDNKRPYFKQLNLDDTFDEIQSFVNGLETDIDNLPTGHTQEIVNISSAQILAMGTSPVELLPAAGAGKYYDYYGFIEFNEGTTPYTNTQILALNDGWEVKQVENPIDFGEKTFIKISSINYSQGVGSNILHKTQGLNQNVSLGTIDNSNPTDGDGTLRVVIYYKVRTFGE